MNTKASFHSPDWRENEMLVRSSTPRRPAVVEIEEDAGDDDREEAMVPEEPLETLEEEDELEDINVPTVLAHEEERLIDDA